MHRSYKDIGDNFSDGWGFDDLGDFEATIRNLKHEKLVVSLLASIANSLKIIRTDLDSVVMDAYRKNKLESKGKDSEANAIADGLLQATLELLGDVAIEKMDLSRLSVRARQALRRSGFRMRSQITKDALMEVRGCWTTTTNEILEWVATAR